MKIVLLMFFLFCAGGVHAAERSLVIDLATQTVVFIEDGHVIRAGIVSTGRKEYETPKGTFRVIEKVRHRYSRQHKTPMLFSIRFHKGYFLHLGTPTGEVASAGCVRLRPEDALYAFKFVNVGDKIVIQ